MGKRQRATGLSHVTDEQVRALARGTADKALRRRAVREAKYRGLRNIRKRKDG